MKNVGLGKSHTGIRIAGRTSNNFRNADDTTLMAENEEELKRLLIKVKEESEKAGLKQHSKKIMESSPINSWPMDEEYVEIELHFTFLGSRINADGDYSHEIKRRLFFGRLAITNLDSILKNRHHFADKDLYS